MGRERGGHKRLDRGARGRSTTRHARRDDQREREGPYRSTMKAQDWNLLIHAVQSSTPARLACRQWTISSRHRLPLPMTSALPIALQAPPSAAPATRLPLAPQSTTHLYVASARMREIWRTGCVARTAETPSTTLAAAVSAAFVAWPKSIDVPLSSPKRQKLVVDGPRAAPADARPYRHLGPSEQPSRRTPTAPVVGLDRFCIAVQ